MSKRVRLIMGLSAVALIGILIILIAVQNYLYNEPSSKDIARTIPALGQADARPQISDFQVMTDDNKMAKVSDLKGRVVHINFWASWCTPCIAELPMIESLVKVYGLQRYTPILVNLDHNPESKAEAEKLQLQMAPSVYKRYFETKSLSEQFKVEALPYHLLVDKEGRVAAVFSVPLDKNAEKFISTLQALDLEVGTR